MRGEIVVMHGFPAGHTGELPLSFIADVLGTLDVGDRKLRRVLVNGTFSDGTSGGPVIEARSGEVIGVSNAIVREPSPGMLAAMRDLEGQVRFDFRETIVDGRATTIIESALEYTEQRLVHKLSAMSIGADLHALLNRSPLAP